MVYLNVFVPENLSKWFKYIKTFNQDNVLKGKNPFLRDELKGTYTLTKSLQENTKWVSKQKQILVAYKTMFL